MAARSGADEIEGARERLGWEYPPFVVPDDVLAAWRAAGARGAAVRQAGKARLAGPAAEDKRGEFQRRQRRELPAAVDQALAAVCDEFREATPRSRPARRRARCSTR